MPWTFQVENYNTGRVFAAYNYGEGFAFSSYGRVCSGSRSRRVATTWNSSWNWDHLERPLGIFHLEFYEVGMDLVGIFYLEFST